MLLEDSYSTLVNSEDRLREMLKLLEESRRTWEAIANVDFGSNEPAKLILNLKDLISNWLYQCDLYMK